MTVRIAGTGSYLPARVVTNDEIVSQLQSTAEWIYSHTGIVSRHVAAPEESAATMGAAAARAAMAAAGADPADIGLIVLTTTTPDYSNYPSTACLVQAELGCANAAAFDLSAACSGFVYGLETAKCYLLAHPARKALVIGSEILSRHIDWTDRSNAMLFGDGAGAVVLEAVPGEAPPFVRSLLGADGAGAALIRREGGARCFPTADPVHAPAGPAGMTYLQMDGHAVFTFAVRKLAEILGALCHESGVEPEALDLVFAHQANVRILDAVARRMKLPMERFYTNLKTVGNTSSASIPLCLDRAAREGALKDGMRLALAGFGSGLTWAGALVEWPYV
ncbi:MAG: beta-ketoacyl-ACP synthase III [Kiritimatiellia bacterium]